jgi:pSer/pThr/pTyr-binding forkhead associated (FHA) protein
MKDRKAVDAELQEILASAKSVRPEASAPPRNTLAQLVGEGNIVFAITKETTLIGRQDPVTNLLPDIDLTAADPQRSVSRRHAKLQLLDGQFFVIEEVGVSNGTFIDGTRLKPGQPAPVANGATVTFGRLALRFNLLPPESVK